MRNSIPLLAAALSLLLIFVGAKPAAAENANLEVGGRKIAVPAPPGFVRSDGVNAMLDKAAAALLPASNRSLISFSTKEDVEILAKGEMPHSKRSFNIQIVRSIENREIGEKTFADVREEARRGLEAMRANLDAEVKKLVASGNLKLSKEAGAEVALSISDTAMLGFFDEAPSSLGFTMGMKIAAKSDGNTPPQRRLAAAVMTPVNGRLLNLYAYADYDSEADRQWAEKAVTAWRDAIRDANPKVQGPSGGGFDFSRILRSALIGGAIGGAIGLVRWLSKRKKMAA